MTLVNDYGYPANHIHVVMSDGMDDAADQLTTSGTINSQQDLLGKGTEVDIKRATKANVTSAINSGWPTTLSSADTLLIFTTGHGEVSSSNINTGDANNNAVNLLLWGTGEKIKDSELVTALPSGPKILMVMEQCNGGGFKNDFIPTSGTNTRVLAAAAKGNQVSHNNDYSYYWITGVAGKDSKGNQVNADTTPTPNGDGQISMREAHTFANDLDPSRVAGTETPTLSEWIANMGSSTFVSACANPRTITVTQPAATWHNNTAYTVKWSVSSNIPGSTLLKIELWKGTGDGTYQATISSSVAASVGTTAGVSYPVPSTLPGGAGTDYWIKIYTISLTPRVTGTSTNINLPDVGKMVQGALTVSAKNKTSGASITDANIILRDSAFKPVSIGGVQQSDTTKTPHTYTPLDSSFYNVKVTRSCYYDASSLVKVNPGIATPASFPAVLIPVEGNCNNPGASGSIAITSLPEEGFRVYLKGSADPAYLDMGYNTPVIQDIGVGVYMVKLMADGYESQEKTVTVTAGDEARADFVLTKISDVNAQVLIVPQPLNIGRTGYFLAFVKLQTGYKAADVVQGSVSCEGAPALKIVRINFFPQIFVAIFKREDLAQYVGPKDRVTLHVKGAIKRSNGNVLFMGSNTIKVFSQKVTTKEDVDSVMTMPDAQVFTKFNKF
jgi:hypothetical protein